MSGERIDAINKALPELHNEIGSNPVVSDKTQFCVIGFADDAQVLLPLSDLSQVASLPVLSIRGGTSFGAAFSQLKAQIDSDVAALKAAGHTPYRPAVFFLTDGYPLDHWVNEYKALIDPSNPYRPNIISFGIGDADASVVAQVATLKAFMSTDSMNPAGALQEFAAALTHSILRSGSSATPDGVTLQVPQEVEGFESIVLEPV
jgi:uncharacterized protein YegL